MSGIVLVVDDSKTQSDRLSWSFCSVQKANCITSAMSKAGGNMGHGRATEPPPWKVISRES